MKAKSIAALLVASSASLAVPSIASGYGPSPSNGSDAGAPAAQRGQTIHAKAAEDGQGSVVGVKRRGVGGEESVRSQSGRRVPTDSIDPMYRGG
ncbi:hypothetical protein LMG28614_03644 [Paraburkholderia ultramafica]|uniref:DUF680 domain-containing protein n=2 Tax=Paraburkholderia ultramafica TaxID=1544867 RepID=A0A6S7BA77_9BURK|nr:hypothetical protein [Paraburkholderia ultramafica]CAB3793078.1 hypothetical protein LMG28614_03644 [Paraburkholderia ultramafica]